MRVVVVSVLVKDQQKALEFYTDVLGFVRKHDVPLGEHRWLTVVSPEQPDGPEVLLEPIGMPAAGAFQRSLHAAGVPLTSFGVADVDKEHDRLAARGVRFTMPPTQMGPVRLAVLDDTCGNLIQIAQT
ncbi:MAG TPA: VOC family protein [Candidatus Thermoplasmatota archaeon]|nr:VOC family protein [Candidatus Thermoplasmatota archaeon]